MGNSIRSPLYRNDSQNADLLATQIRGQISAGFLRRDEAHLRQVFDQYKDPATNTILKPNLVAALTAFNVIAQDDDADVLFYTIDRNDDQQIDLEEFRRAVYKPMPLEQWAQTLPLSQLLADAIPKKRSVEPLRVVGTLTHNEINIISVAIMEGLQKILREHSAKLSDAFAAQERFAKQSANSMASKFEVCSMSCGRIKDFHEGLSGRVGAPHLNFLQAMESEHCSKAGWSMSFTSINYNIGFTPKQEWDIVVNDDISKADMRHGRQLRKIDDLVATDLCKTADLRRFEVIAVVMYTGPMYMIYNAILRQYAKEHYEPFAKGGNLFATTIHALVSAVQKIARVMKLPSGLLLYRGLGGTVALPDYFFKGDDQGCRGFADWGFMSTTSSKQVACSTRVTNIQCK